MNKTLLAGLALAAMARAASAQYIFLDCNGDQFNDASDRLNPNGTPTPVDVWIWTDTNADGSPAPADTGGSGNLHTINSYVINLLAASGTVAYSGFMDQQGMGTHLVTTTSNATQYKNGYGSGNILPPGAYRLCTLTITGMTGTPRIGIERGTAGGGAYYTSFGTQCLGLDGDNTYKLGTDWPDPAGAAGAGSATGPIVTNPGAKTATQGELLTFTVTSSNLTPGLVNAYSLTLGVPTATGAAIDAASGVFTWTPPLTLAPGAYPVTVTATDNALPPESRSEAFIITVLQASSPKEDLWGKSCSAAPGAGLTIGLAGMLSVILLARRR